MRASTWHRRTYLWGIVAASITGGLSRGQTQTSTWVGTDSTAWSNPANWSPGGAPNNNTNGFSDYNVIIGAPSPTTLDISPTIDNLTVNSTGLIDIPDLSTLNVAGNLLDNGSIVVDSNFTNRPAVLNFNGGTVSGSGSILLEQSSDAEVNGSLTQAAGHTIQGYGQINASLTNNGLINANVNGQTLTLAGSITNNNLIEATNGGGLVISQCTITQANSGQITISNTSSGVISNANISGGSLDGAGSFTVSGTSSLNNVTNNSTIGIDYYQQLNITGNLVDNGSIIVDSSKTNRAAVLNFSGGTVSGTGSIILQQGGNNAEVNGSVTQTSGHTIQGYGQINASLTNNGLINANVNNGQTLTLAGSITNNTLIEATNGGELVISQSTLTQANSGQITISNTSSGVISNATISGGSLGGAGGFTVAGTSTLNNVTNNTSIGIDYFQQLNITGNLVNNGSIIVDSSKTNRGAVLNFIAGTLSGTGSVTLQEGGNNAQLDGSLTQSAGHTIQGYGQINANVINDGTISSNVGGQTLAIVGDLTNNGLIQSNNSAGLTISLTDGTAVINNGTLQANNASLSVSTPITNNGLILSTSSASMSIAGTLTNAGFIQAQNSGSISISSPGFLAGGNTLSGGSYEVDSNSSITFSGSVQSNAAVLTISGSGNFNSLTSGSSSFDNNTGTFTLENGANYSGALIFGGTEHNNFTNSGTLVVGTGSSFDEPSYSSGGQGSIPSPGSFTQSGGLTLVNGTLDVPSSNQIGGGVVTINGGVVAGTGLLEGGNFVTYPGSSIHPGSSAADGNVGTLTLEFAEDSASFISIEGDVRMDITPTANDQVITYLPVAFYSTSTITPVFSGTPVAGTYTLFPNIQLYTGQDVTPILPVLVNTLPAGSRFSLSLNSQVQLVVAGTAANLTWIGSVNGGAWDLQNSQNWYNPTVDGTEQADDEFYSLDNVAFDDTASGFNVVLNSVLTPSSVTVTNSSHNYTISGSGGIGGTAGLTKMGSGTLTLSTNNTYSGPTSVQGGKLIIASAGALPTGANVSISATAELQMAAGIGTATIDSLTIANSGIVDITNNTLTLPYTGTSPAGTLRGYLTSGYQSGQWTGTGIISSTAADDATHATSIGYSDNGAQVEIKYTWLGDSNLDGVVNASDLSAISPTGTTWATGDFNYDGMVNADDYALFMLGAAYGTVNISTTLPEPGVMLALGGLLCLRRARKA